MNETLSIIISLLLGIGLSASCGFRVFVPLLAASVAAHFGIIPVAGNMAWLSTWPAMIALGAATVFEIAAYYIPWVDNILDTVASPLAVIAGGILSVSVITDLDPTLQWGLGLMVGGTSAGVVQASTSLLRLGSTAATGGTANPVIATIEHGVSILGSILTIWIPALFGALLFILVCVLGYFMGKKIFKKKESPSN